MSRRGRVTSLAFPLPPAVFPLDSQRSLRRSRGSHLCLLLHRPGYRPMLSGARGAGAVVSGTRGGEGVTSTTAPTTTPGNQSGAAGHGPLPRACGHPAGVHGPPCARPRAQVGAPPATVAHLVPCSASPETADVTTRSCDVTGIPPSSRCVPPGLSEVAAPVPWLTPLPAAAPSRLPAYAWVPPRRIAVPSSGHRTSKGGVEMWPWNGRSVLCT
ncbi:UNVERIFIED_CONTAM: hypothetical protein FKN15_058536 [Acipenser sinensis]